MPIVTVETNEQLLAEYQSAGEKPVIFYFFQECDTMCDESTEVFDAVARDNSEAVHVIRVKFSGQRIVEGTDFTVGTLPTVIVGINGIEVCEDTLEGEDVEVERLEQLFDKYS